MNSSNLETADGAAPTDPGATPADDDTASATPVAAARKPRASRRVAKTDTVLEAAVERARLGVLDVVPESQVGRHVSAIVEGERLVTHRFEAFLPGYGGWQWYATVARVSRSKDVTVCDVGLLPSESSLVAPEWLPWSERVRPEDSPQPDEASTPDDAAPSQDPADTPSTGVGDALAVGDAGLDDDADESVDEPAPDLNDDEFTADADESTDDAAGQPDAE